MPQLHRLHVELSRTELGVRKKFFEHYAKYEPVIAQIKDLRTEQDMKCFFDNTKN
jgi:hypothetical protein